MPDKDLEICYNNCIEYSNKKKNPILRDCVLEIYNDYKDRLLKVPATPGRHHYFKGGLLYHLYSVTRNSYTISTLYPNLNIDVDLLIFGSLLHDIGKALEYNSFTTDDNYISVKGNERDLLGHTYKSTHIVDNYLSKYELDDNFKNQVLHIIGSHMRDFGEEGALVKPKMIETIIISYSDNIDNYLEPASKAIDRVTRGEQYEFPKGEIPYYKSLNPYYEERKDK